MFPKFHQFGVWDRVTLTEVNGVSLDLASTYYCRPHIFPCFTPHLPQPHQLFRGSLCADEKALWAISSLVSSAPLSLIISAALVLPCDAQGQGWHQVQPYAAGPLPSASPAGAIIVAIRQVLQGPKLHLTCCCPHLDISCTKGWVMGLFLSFLLCHSGHRTLPCCLAFPNSCPNSPQKFRQGSS